MSSANQAVQVYQLRIWIRRISLQIWRRLLVRSDSTIAELHDILQIAFGWSNDHLHQFLIRGKPYGIGRSGESALTTISTRYDCVTSTSA
jgi:hypothetical protein